MIDHKIKLISYLSQYKEEMPLWLTKYTDGSKVNFLDIMSSRIGYYPGSGYDGSLIEIGNRSHTIHSFLYVDYLLTQSDLIEHLKKPNSIYGYHSIGRIEWQEKDLVLNGPHSMHLNRLQGRNHMAFKPEQPYCFTEIMERDHNRDDSWGAERFAITFLCADGIATYLQLFCGEYKKAPWLVLLQDHGFGCNYDKFGKGGILDEIIKKTGIKSYFVLCDDNTRIWDGYTKIDEVPPISGGMHRDSRFLYKLSEQL
jgi:hypothetical protein